MRPTTSLTEFYRSLWLTLAMFAVVALTFGIYTYLEKQVDRANEQRIQSFRLADELRQSSDDLTRMVRTYVATGDPAYKRHYQEILEIRDGRRPRPVDYDNVYWDLVLADDARPRLDGPAISLLERMRHAGFSAEEFDLLAQAKTNSDDLTHLEYAAMALVETSRTSAANRLHATGMLNGAAYHQAKHDIMQPIAEFYRRVDRRTLAAVRAAVNLAYLVRLALILFGLLLAYTLWRAYRSLHATLGGPVDALQRRIARLGSGDFATPIPVARGMENSVMAWLSATQAKLAESDAERRRAEDELRRYKDRLEDEVQRRTADLVLARNAAEAANRAKSVFLANMTHELRTPLNAILGFSGMLLKDASLPSRQREQLDIVNRNGRHLLNLIDDVLEMSKIEAGRARVASAPFDLGGLVRDIAGSMLTRAREKGLKLRVELAADVPRHIRGDEARLRRVLVDLVGNAIKFTRQGGVGVRLAMRPGAAPPCLLIEVEDSGVGIAPEDREKIFEPFVQLGEQAAQQGTGLGLTITRQYVQEMGGRIGVESAPGSGSLFRVELPVDPVEAGDPAADAGPAEYRILIVDDPTREAPLSADRLALLPPDLRDELRAALESLEGDRIDAAIRQTATCDAALHQTLSRLAENFDYPGIISALQENPPEGAR